MPTVTLTVADDFSRVLDAYVQKTTQAETESSKLATGLLQTEVASKKMAQATQTHTATLGDLYYGLGLARQGLAALEGAYNQTVGTTIKYATSVRDLSEAIGSSTEQASKLIYAANVTGVSIGTLEAGIKAAIRTMQSSKSEGIAPTIEGLGQLADKYNALSDPIQRTAFLMHNFGRSGADLQDLMQLGSAGLKSLGDQAEATGTVLSAQSVGSMYQYEQQTKRLAASFDGLKIQITTAVLPALMFLTDSFTTHVQAILLANKALATGAVNLFEYFHVSGTAAEQVQYFTDKINAQTPAVVNLTDKFQTYASLVGAGATAVSDAASKQYEFRETLQRTDQAQSWATLGNHEAALALQDYNNKLMDTATLLGVSGVVTRNYQTYSQVVSGNADKIAALRAEIAKYTDLQGQSITVVNKGQYSAEQFAVAQERLAIATQRLTEYHGQSQATLMSLALSVQTAQDAVDKMAGHMATSETSSADYSTKIAEDQKALDKLTLANELAELAMHNANKEFVLQQAAAGLTGKALYDFELYMGAIDKPTYNAVLALQAADAEYKKTGDLDAYETSVSKIVDVLNGVPPAASEVPEALSAVTEGFWLSQQSAASAAGSVHDFNYEESLMQDKTVTLTVNTVYNHYGDQSENPNAGMPTARARGGPVSAGVPYTVGERGPELFVPSQGGTIIPNRSTTMNFGGVTIHAAPGQDGVSLWNSIKVAAAREARGLALAGAAGLGSS